MYTVNLRSNCQTILSIFIIFQFDGRSTLIQMQTGACSEWYSMSVLFYLVQKRSQVENLFDAAAMYYSLILPLASVWVDICVCVCIFCGFIVCVFFSLPDLPLFFMYFFVSEKPHPKRLIYLQSFVFHMFSHITRIGPCTPSIFHSFLPPFGMFDSGSNCRMVI